MTSVAGPALRLGFAGCGNIAERYAEDCSTRPEMALHGFFDVVPERARALAARHGGLVYGTLEELLADADVDVVVNLTIFEAHYEVVKAALRSGKHVYSEKPLALTSAHAFELVALAAERGVALAGAPFTFLGAAQQQVARLIAEGAVGEVRLVYAEVNHGRIEAWHPNPAPFYAVGPLLDVGVYPLTLVTALFGPAERVTAFATKVASERTTASGERFKVEAPDFWVVNLELQGGVVVRLTANFYVPTRSHQGETVEFHGDGGTIRLESWHHPGAAVDLWTYEGEVTPVKVDAPRYHVDWSAGLVEFAAGLQGERPSRLQAAHAAHVVEILEASQISAAEGRPVTLSSRFDPPPPL